MSLQTEYNLITSQHTTRLLLLSKFYEQEDKTSKLLTHRLHQMSASQLNPQVKTEFGVTSDPLEMNKTFMEFYTSLYTSDHSQAPVKLESFFSKLTLPILNQTMSERLECPKPTLELETALKSLQSGPGPEGFPSEFYKIFWKQLAPYLFEMFIEAFVCGTLPHTLNQPTPMLANWLKEVLHFLELEKIRLTLSGSKRTFEKTWNPFLSYVKSTEFPFN